MGSTNKFEASESLNLFFSGELPILLLLLKDWRSSEESLIFLIFVVRRLRSDGFLVKLLDLPSSENKLGEESRRSFFSALPSLY